MTNTETLLEHDVTEFGKSYGITQVKAKPGDPIQVNFSGYPVPPESKQTVSELEAYYLKPGCKVDGCPISGDQSARYRYWQRSGIFPRFRDLPEHMPTVKPSGAIF